jgi:hypothetical protein
MKIAELEIENSSKNPLTTQHLTLNTQNLLFEPFKNRFITVFLTLHISILIFAPDPFPFFEILSGSTRKLPYNQYNQQP